MDGTSNPTRSTTTTTDDDDDDDVHHDDDDHFLLLLLLGVDDGRGVQSSLLLRSPMIRRPSRTHHRRLS